MLGILHGWLIVASNGADCRLGGIGQPLSKTQDCPPVAIASSIGLRSSRIDPAGLATARKIDRALVGLEGAGDASRERVTERDVSVPGRAVALARRRRDFKYSRSSYETLPPAGQDIQLRPKNLDLQGRAGRADSL